MRVHTTRARPLASTCANVTNCPAVSAEQLCAMRNPLVLTSTNLALPAGGWNVVTTNSFDASGNFNFTGTNKTSTPQQFYLIKCQLLELP